MIHPGRAGEHGFWFFALGWEGVKLAALILIPATVALVGAGMYGAAVYDQGHSRDPLSAGGGGQAESHPSVSFTDFSPVGLHEDCILGVAREFGLSWDGGALGWTAADPPRLRGSDALSDSKVQAWRNQMSGLLGRASREWHDRCEKPELATPAPRSNPTPEPALDVNGTYNVESGSISECAVVEGSGSVPSLKVSRSGDSLTVSFPGFSRTLRGTISDDLTFKANYQDPAGGGVDMDGRFTAGTGGDVLLRDGNVLVSSSGGGLVAHPCTTTFFAKKSAP